MIFAKLLNAYSHPTFSTNNAKRSLLCSDSSKKVRRKIEVLDNRLNLPLAKKSLSIFEGEHPSSQKFGNGDLVDVHAWQPGDEARMINWKASARVGEPMVSSRQRESSSKTWILVDSSVNMNASCASKSNEYLYEIASNAACFFASLSIKRNDSLNCALFDGDNVLRIPSCRNLPDFERSLDISLCNARKNTRNTDAIIDFANSITQKHGLIVIITDEYAILQKHFNDLQKIARLHSLIVVTLSPVNPFSKSKDIPILDGTTMRKIPAFLVDDSCCKEVKTHRAFINNSLHECLNSAKACLIRGSSSKQIFHSLAKFICNATLQNSVFSVKKNQDLLLK